MILCRFARFPGTFGRRAATLAAPPDDTRPDRAPPRLLGPAPALTPFARGPQAGPTRGGARADERHSRDDEFRC